MTEYSEFESIDELLDVVGVKRVVVIDDTYAEKAPVADLISTLNKVPPEVAAAVLTEFDSVDFAGDSDIRDAAIRGKWWTIEPARRSQILQELRTKTSVEDDTDQGAKDLLSELFRNRGFNGLSLQDWNMSKDSVLQDPSLALILIDEDFSKEGGTATQGLYVVKEVLDSTVASNVLCALLSHKYPSENIHERWEQLCEEHGFDKGRFVLIPKATIDDDPATFARLIKLASIANPIDMLRSKMTELAVQALSEAEKDLKKIDLYDMDEIVFRSSWKEGVWEPETLLRVFALFHRKHSRVLTMASDELHALARKVRTVSQVVTRSPKQPEHKIWPVQRLEIYEQEEYLNTLHFPLELGDIFQRDGGDQFILLAPPCDLMVRSKGQRTEAMKEALLARISTEETPGTSWELPHFSQTAKHYVHFKRILSVKLFGLDLCVLNDDGRATIVSDQEMPKHLIPSWERRYKDLQQQTKAIFEKVDKAKSSEVNRSLLEQSLARIDHDGTFSPTFQHSTKTLRYNFRRITRLLPPRGQALLIAYSQFLARSPFEHELEVRDDNNNLTAPLKPV